MAIEFEKLLAQHTFFYDDKLDLVVFFIRGFFVRRQNWRFLARSYLCGGIVRVEASVEWLVQIVELHVVLYVDFD